MSSKTASTVVTVAYRIVPGAHYPYVGAKIYRAQYRQDGVPTYRPVREVGPDRRSERLAIVDAQQAAARHCLPFTRAHIRLGSVAPLPHRDAARASVYNNDNH